MISIKTIVQAVLEVLAAFWKSLVGWLRKSIEKIKQALNRVILGAEVLLEKVDGMYRESSHHYSKTDEGKWRKDTVIKQKLISEEDVPADILAKVRYLNEGQRADISENLEKELIMTNG